MRSRLTTTKQQQGVALLATLILIMAVILVLGNIFYRHQIDVNRLTKTLHSDQALLMALSVESWASQMLSSEQDNRDFDSLDENWALAVPLLPLDGGFIRGCINDLQSKININSFGDYSSSSWFDEMNEGGNGLASTWLSILNTVGYSSDQMLTVSIIDWVDENTIALNELGAEQLAYDAARVEVVVANAPLTDIAELSVIRGYNYSIVQQLQPLLTALPKTTTININTAPEILLLAMGAEHAQNFSDYTIEGRPFTNLDEYYLGLSDFLGLNLNEVKDIWSDDLIGISSNYFQLNLQVTMGDSNVEIHSIMDRNNRDEAVVVSRSVSVIPQIIAETYNDSLESEDNQAPAFCENTGLLRS